MTVKMLVFDCFIYTVAFILMILLAHVVVVLGERKREFAANEFGGE